MTVSEYIPQTATTIIEHLTYNEIDDQFDISIFTANQLGYRFSNTSEKLKKHIYDYAITDSDVENQFVTDLDNSYEVTVYAKLPRDFLIPTPVGDYNPDWAISIQKGKQHHFYFVAETKGSMSSMTLRMQEKNKIECAKKYFKKIVNCTENDNVIYRVVNNYNQLMDFVSNYSQNV